MLTTMLLIALAPINPPAYFVDYVFNVPVRIENMRSVTMARLNCGISHVEGGIPTALGIGGYTMITLVDGSFNGTVTVTVPVSSADAIRIPPTNYQCGLVYQWRNPDGSTFSASMSYGERAVAYTRLTGQDISENTTQISGLIPPP